MPEKGLSAEQWLQGATPSAPPAVKLAAALVMGYGMFSVVASLGILLLMRDASPRSALIIPGFFGAVLWVWAGANLLKLRHWAVTLGRVLSGFAAVIGVVVIWRAFAVDPPVVLAARLIQVAIAWTAAVVLFSPDVRRAFKRPPDATQHWITNRGGPPPPP
jgi:hypothetical protein